MANGPRAAAHKLSMTAAIFTRMTIVALPALATKIPGRKEGPQPDTSGGPEPGPGVPRGAEELAGPKETAAFCRGAAGFGTGLVERRKGSSLRHGSDADGKGLFRVHLEVLDGAGHQALADAALLRQGVKGGDDHHLGVHLEEAPEVLAGVAAAKAVGAQGGETARNPGGDRSPQSPEFFSLHKERQSLALARRSHFLHP